MFKILKNITLMFLLIYSTVFGGESTEINIQTRFGVGGVRGVVVAPEKNLNENVLRLDHGDLLTSTGASGNIIIGHTYEGSVTPLSQGSSGTLSFSGSETNLINELVENEISVPTTMKISHSLSATLANDSKTKWEATEALLDAQNNKESAFNYSGLETGVTNTTPLVYTVTSIITETMDELEKKQYGNYKNITTINVRVEIPTSSN